jgi:hypothetical protein
MLEFLFTAVVAGILGNSADRAVQGFLDAVTPPSTFERWIVRLVVRAFAPSQRQTVGDEWIAQLYHAKRRERPALIVGLVSGLPAQVRHPVGAKQTSADHVRWSREIARVAFGFLLIVTLSYIITGFLESISN